MKNETQHTPTIVDFEAGMNDSQAAEALRRWNAHDELVAALKTAHRIVLQSSGYNDGNRAHTFCVEEIEAALAKAEARS